MSASRDLPASDRLARLRLARTTRVGPVTYRQLIARFGDAQSALDALPDLARRGGAKRRFEPQSLAKAKAELAQIDSLGAAVLFWGMADYPHLLAAIEDAPPVVIIQGHRDLLTAPVIGIVGARNASAAGRRLTYDLAQTLGAEGLIIASGLARGIDTAAHQGSLATGTIAAIAGGLDVVYPPENADLQRQIGQQGCLVTEMPPGTQPSARLFPRRNRVIAGLSLGVLVVEAAERSGSLITARLAGEQGREVFAVPGSPLDPRARGTNRLIQDGARLVQDARDILDEIATLRRRDLDQPPRRYQDATPASQDPTARERALVAEALSPTPVVVDDIIRTSGLDAAVVLTILLEMELAGAVDRHAGGRVSATGFGS